MASDIFDVLGKVAKAKEVKLVDPPDDVWQGCRPVDETNRIMEAWLESLPEPDRRAFELAGRASDAVDVGDPTSWPAHVKRMMSETGLSGRDLQRSFSIRLGEAAGKFLLQVLQAVIAFKECVENALVPEHVARTLVKLKGLSYDQLTEQERLNLRFVFSKDGKLDGTPWGGKSVIVGRGVPLDGSLAGISIVDVRVGESDRGNRAVFTFQGHGREVRMALTPAPEWLVPRDSRRGTIDDRIVVDFDPPRSSDGGLIRRPGEKPPLCLAGDSPAPGRPRSARHEAAYRAFELAEQKTGRQLTLQQAYKWLEDNDAEGYELPAEVTTFGRYVRAARKFYGTQRNSSRCGRTGRSIATAEDIQCRQGDGDG